MLEFITTPIPHVDAVKLIQDKPAVARDVFDALPDEIQGRSFTITGIEDFDVLQAVRDEISKLPAGADWNAVKKDVIGRISPWFTPEGAENRAELLMRHHAFSAYAACEARIQDSMRDVFPFYQYLSTEDDNVRASHRALNGIIVAADHPFWKFHTPPWEPLCRCQRVALTQEDKDEEERLDARRLPEKQRVLKGAALNQLNTGTLNRGPSLNADIRTPREKGGRWQWSAEDAAIPYDQIRDRWEPDTRADFEAWAARQLLDLGTNLLQWLLGNTKLMGRN